MKSSNWEVRPTAGEAVAVREHFPHAHGPFQMALEGIRARPVAPAVDMVFLQALYASTRREEMGASGWPAAEQEMFLAQQFALQHRYYQAHHADASFLLLTRDDEPVGRLYWRDDHTEVALIDVSLVPGERGLGIGSALLALLTSQADHLGQAIGLYVEPHNRARRLYGRFGFDVFSNNGVYVRMRRSASPQAAWLEGVTA